MQVDLLYKFGGKDRRSGDATLRRPPLIPRLLMYVANGSLATIHSPARPGEKLVGVDPERLRQQLRTEMDAQFDNRYSSPLYRYNTANSWMILVYKLTGAAC